MSLKITAITRLKHAILWKACKKMGSQAALARHLGVNQIKLGKWVNMQTVPKVRDPAAGQPHGMDIAIYAEIEQKLHELTGLTMDELFPQAYKDATGFLKANKTAEQTVDVPDTALRELGAHTAKRLEYTHPLDKVGDDDCFAPTDDLEVVIAHLPERLAHVIRRRFGINTPEATLEEIGEELGVTKQRVGQMAQQGLRLLRHPACINALGLDTELINPALAAAEQREHESATKKLLAARSNRRDRIATLAELEKPAKRRWTPPPEPEVVDWGYRPTSIARQRTYGVPTLDPDAFTRTPGTPANQPGWGKPSADTNWRAQIRP